MNTKRALSTGVAALAALVCAGIAAAAYALLHERAPVPFRDTYEIRADVTAANGIQPGLGQPVRVAGVTVGTVSGLRLLRDDARVTMQIDRDKLAHVYADATVTLHPVTPLMDMQVVLAPGRPPAPPLPEGSTIQATNTSVPVPLGDLLSTLDADTRTFLSSLLSAVHTGVDGRGPDIRRALAALGPAAGQMGRVSRELAQRRRQLARLVHNVSLVTDEAADQGQLSQLIASARRTLVAVAAQDRPLRQTIARLPHALRTTSAALDETARFAAEMPTALDALRPALRGAPPALDALGDLAKTGNRQLPAAIRPFVRSAVPALGNVGPAISELNRQSTDLLTGLKGLNYTFNELAYNPPGQKLGKDDEGFLFWLPWFFHNYNSAFSFKDAHGGGARGMVMVSCQQLLSLAGFDEILRVLLPTYALCPEK
jgi:phospholipid/cholesterol/gamma-HCH transport system substrate-binding protein